MKALALHIAMLMLLAVSVAATAERSEPQVTKVYSLKHAVGGDVVSLLQSLFIVVDQQNAYARFQFDERTDSLIVSASGQHQAQIARTLALVDVQDKTAAVAVRRDDSPQAVRGYPIKPADGEAAVAVLRSLFLVVNHQAAYARFGHDARTGLLIAIASEQHHRQIAEVLGTLAERSPPTDKAPEPAAAGQSLRVYPIKHIDGEQLVSKLRSQFVVVNHEQAETRFGFDPRTRSLLVIARNDWHARVRDTIAVLDQPPERRSGNRGASNENRSGG
jgi:type II secretory pathway component GspD/PulD (secretin)